MCWRGPGAPDGRVLQAHCITLGLALPERSPCRVWVSVHQLSRADARRIAVRAQLPGGWPPAGLIDLVRHLTLVPIHQDVRFAKAATAAIGREIQDLAHWLELDLALPGAGTTPPVPNRSLSLRQPVS